VNDGFRLEMASGWLGCARLNWIRVFPVDDRNDGPGGNASRVLDCLLNRDKVVDLMLVNLERTDPGGAVFIAADAAFILLGLAVGFYACCA
jgi:hypothetical protein